MSDLLSPSLAALVAPCANDNQGPCAPDDDYGTWCGPCCDRMRVVAALRAVADHYDWVGDRHQRDYWRIQAGLIERGETER